jgi:hypothetical protein
MEFLNQLKVYVFVSILTTTIFAIPCFAATINVNWDGTGDYTTIQAGINATVNGDTVIVAPGTYVENINFGGKNVILTSTNINNPATTIIDGGNNGSVVTFSGTETPSCTLSGFTITDGDEGGIRGNETQATITNCIITGNTARNVGGGMYMCNGIIRNCTIKNNTIIGTNTWGGGGGLSICAGEINNCFIINNNASLASGGGLNLCHGRIQNCVIAGNTARVGGGLSSCYDKINNCTIVGNTAVYGGGVSNSDYITNCILWYNDATDSDDQLRSSSAPSYSCIQGWTGGGAGNISSDPFFVDISDPDHTNWDLHLQAGSPCIDTATNTPSGGLPATDIEGTPLPLDGDDNGTATADMGTYEYFTGPVISLSANTFTFTAVQDEANPGDQTLTITNIGFGTLNWSVSEGCSWLSVSPASGSSTGEGDDVTLSVNTTGMTGGQYSCVVTVTDPAAANDPQTVTVDLDITGPILDVSSTAFSFTAEQGGADPNDQSLTVSNTGDETVNWSIDTAGKPAWLTIMPTSGSLTEGTSEPVTLSVDITGVLVGSYSYAFDVSDPNASNSPQSISVTLGIIDPALGDIFVPIDYPTIQDAIDASVNGDIIVVFPGTYTGSGNRDLDTLGKLITVRSTDPDDPNVVAATIIDCQGTQADAHRGFYFHSGEGRNSVVSGLTIKNGYSYGTDAKGGAIYFSGASPTIEKCILIDNIAHGYNGGFSSNGGHSYGGAIYCDASSDPLILNCQITSNQAIGGDGGSGQCSPMSGWDPPGTGGNAYGGGIYSTSDCLMTIENCIISSNISIGGYAGEPIMDCFPVDEGDGYGGGIYGNAVFIDCQITSNQVVGVFYWGDGTSGHPLNGGGVYISGSTSSVDNCLIAENDLFTETGAPIAGYGAGIYSVSHIDVRNCTIAANTTNFPPSGMAISSPTFAVTNSVIWGHSSNTDLFNGSGSIDYSDIQGWGPPSFANFEADPLFVTGPGGNYYLSHTASGQAATSPCVDAGSDTADNLGMRKRTTRTDEIGDLSIVDMGFHYSMPYPIGDINMDTKVNLADYCILAEQWQDIPDSPSADTAPYPAGDNFVDFDDLLLLMENWLD